MTSMTTLSRLTVLTILLRNLTIRLTSLTRLTTRINCQKFRINYISKRADGKVRNGCLRDYGCHADISPLWQLELNLRREALVADTRVALEQLPVTEWQKRLMIKFEVRRRASAILRLA